MIDWTHAPVPHHRPGKRVALLGLMILLVSCARAAPTLGPVVTPNPNATPTPTPFRPSQSGSTLKPPTPAALHNPDEIWAGFPGPTETSAIEIPPPVPRISTPENLINIIILGSDSRPGFYGSRTDAIMIASLDMKAKKARLISIPRDLYIYLPGWKVNRINTADYHGGPEMVSMAILYNLGIEIHHWVRVSFNGFVSAVNSLGGIDVEVPKTLVDECDEKMIRYPAGMNHLDGYRALCYARVRKASSDFARTKRQQQVLLAVFDKFLSREGLTQAPLLYKEFRNYFETDMRLSDFLRLIPLATAVAGDPDRVQGYTLDLSLVKPWRVPPTGAAVLLPERESIHSTLTTIFSQ